MNRSVELAIAAGIVATLCLTGETAAQSRKEQNREGTGLPETVDLRPELKRLGLEPRSQGKRPTCSVFVTVWALEFAMSRQRGQAESLSVEYLNWASNQVTKDPTDGSFFHDALKGFSEHGICLEKEMSYREKYDPNLQPSDEARRSAKVIGASELKVHWIKHWTPKQGLTDKHMTEIRQALARGWPVAAGSDHSRLLVGFRDDPAQSGGGTFLTQDSAIGGYGTVTYDWVKTKVGDAFWVESKPTQASKSRP